MSLGLVSGSFAEAEKPLAKLAPVKVVVIPIRDQIAKPELYILRRGLKQAIEQKVDTIVLDMETPGGALDVTFDMLKALEKFPGKTITYVNTEAISAGALIAAGTDEIHFAPGAVIGAAAPVLATGGEIDDTMRQKIVSYLRARVRAISEGKGYRGAMLPTRYTKLHSQPGESGKEYQGDALAHAVGLTVDRLAQNRDEELVLIDPWPGCKGAVDRDKVPPALPAAHRERGYHALAFFWTGWS